MFLLLLFLPLFFCYDTIEIYHNERFVSKITLDYNDKLKIIFNIVDNDNDNYLSYNEINAFQQATDPDIPITVQIFKNICKTMGVNPYIGLDITDLNNSYTIYSDTLGTNIHRDFKKLKNYLSY